MILDGLLVGLIALLGDMESGWFGQHMTARPIVLSTLIGLVFGDLTTGVTIGGSLELIWMGIVSIGATPPDLIVGSTLATAFAIKNNLDIETALALAIPISLVGQIIKMGLSTLCSLMTPLTDKACEEADPKKMRVWPLLGGFLYSLTVGTIAFCGYMIGADTVNAIAEAIPEAVSHGMEVAAGMLPALGIAVLMQMTFSKKYAPFFFLGFALVAFLNLQTLGVAVFGAIIALIYYFFKTNKSSQDEEDLL